MECENCSKKCPQMELADECAKGRMYATQELIKCQKELEQLKVTIKAARAKAIDDFVEKLDKKITDFILEHKSQLTFVSGVSMAWKFVDEIAEQLKGGNVYE